jgi:hypothetical protein
MMAVAVRPSDASAERVAQVPVQTAAPCLPCQVLSVTADQISLLPPALNGARILVRLTADDRLTAASEAIQTIRRRGGRPGVHAIGVPAADSPVLAGFGDLLVIEVSDGDFDRLAFDLKRALSAARGASPQSTLLVAGDARVLGALRDRALGPYADGFVPPAEPISRSEDLLAPTTEAIDVRRLPADPGVAWNILGTSAALQSWFPAGLALMRERALTCGDDRRLTTYLNSATLDLVAVSGSCPPAAAVTSDISGQPVERLDVGGLSAFRVRANTEGAFASQVDVAASRTLTADEIVARHQAAAARQAAEIATEISDGMLTLTFEAPGFVAPITITSRTTIYRDRTRTDLQQTDIRVDGVPFSGNRGAPRLPIIEPERAVAPPLAITLTNVYRYQLDGRDTIDGRRTYVVSFTPRDSRAALYQGRAWIDAATFGMRRISAVQTGLKGPITASEQTDDFALDAAGHWLLARSDVRQTYEGASVRTPIHRLLTIERHELNATDFIARRGAAYTSNDVMLRDTPNGYRYLRKTEGAHKPEGAAVGTEPTRIVAPRVDRIRTLAFGVIVDPNISVPLPFAGLSYVDFHLFGTGAQLNGFFGGTYGQVAFSAPSLGGTRWQLGGRAFGIASSYNDRQFSQGREQYELDIRQRPADGAIWLLHPLSPRTGVRLEYDWDYTKFAAGDQTAPAFVVPRNQNAHAIRLGLDLQRAGWQAAAWGSVGRRIGWRAWGLPGDPDAIHPRSTYERFGLSLLRSQSLSPRLSTRVEAALLAGSNLDRFSRYSFGTFENRLHGYPSALVRYDRGGALRTAIAWRAVTGLRLDGFADTAEVHDPGFGRRLRNYTGFGAAAEVPAPFGTLLAVEWGYGLRGVNTNGHMGTHVVRISGYKMF